MPDNKYEIVPLTGDEKDWLMTIYNTRRKNLMVSFFGYIAIFAIPASAIGFFIYVLLGDMQGSLIVQWLAGLNLFSPWFFAVMIAVGLSSYVCFMSFLSDILPYKKDAVSGVKQKVPYYVKTRGYNEMTEEYIISFEGLDKAYDVDEKTYRDAEVGSQIYMGQALISKYIFSLNNSYTPFVRY